MAGRWRSPRIDANQPAVVSALEAAGWTVYSLASIGGPVDLLVADRNHTWLCEVKDPAQSRADQALKPRCATFLRGWPGPVAIVQTVENALHASEAVRAGLCNTGLGAVLNYEAWLAAGFGKRRAKVKV